MKIRKLPFDYGRLEREMSALMPCAHLNRIIARKTTSNGRPFRRLQCPECGAALSGRLSKTKVADLVAAGLPEGEWNDRLALQHSIKRHRLSCPIVEKINAERREAWWTDYEIYLKSDAWKKLAADTMKRARYVCELCKRRKAVHVHHLSYERVGEETLEDLQALCFDCHDQAHDGRLRINRIFAALDAEFGISPTNDSAQ